MNERGLRTDRRWAVRHKVNFDAYLRDPDGLHHAAIVVNISDEGCAFNADHQTNLTLKDMLTVEIRGLAPIAGTVVWSNKDQYGFAFTTPLGIGTVQGLAMKSLISQLILRLTQDKNSSDDKHIYVDE